MLHSPIWIFMNAVHHSEVIGRVLLAAIHLHEGKHITWYEEIKGERQNVPQLMHIYVTISINFENVHNLFWHIFQVTWR